MKGYTDNRACSCWDLQSLLVLSETWGYNQVQSINWQTPSFTVGANRLEVPCELIFVADNLKLLKKLKKIVSTHTHTNNYVICLGLLRPTQSWTKTVVNAALACTHRITQYHKLHGGRLHGELPKPQKQPKLWGGCLLGYGRLLGTIWYSNVSTVSKYRVVIRVVVYFTTQNY